MSRRKVRIKGQHLVTGGLGNLLFIISEKSKYQQGESRKSRIKRELGPERREEKERKGKSMQKNNCRISLIMAHKGGDHLWALAHPCPLEIQLDMSLCGGKWLGHTGPKQPSLSLGSKFLPISRYQVYFREVQQLHSLSLKVTS